MFVADLLTFTRAVARAKFCGKVWTFSNLVGTLVIKGFWGAKFITWSCYQSLISVYPSNLFSGIAVRKVFRWFSRRPHETRPFHNSCFWRILQFSNILGKYLSLSGVAFGCFLGNLLKSFLTLFRMGFFRAAHGLRGGQKDPPP